VAQDDSDELLRLLILAVLAKTDRPLDAEELAERVAAMVGVPFVPELPRAALTTNCPRVVRFAARPGVARYPDEECRETVSLVGYYINLNVAAGGVGHCVNVGSYRPSSGPFRR